MADLDRCGAVAGQTAAEYTPTVTEDSPRLLATFPPEILRNIFSHLSSSDIYSVSDVCRAFRGAAPVLFWKGCSEELQSKLLGVKPADVELEAEAYVNKAMQATTKEAVTDLKRRTGGYYLWNEDGTKKIFNYISSQTELMQALDKSTNDHPKGLVHLKKAILIHQINDANIRANYKETYELNQRLQQLSKHAWKIFNTADKCGDFYIRTDENDLGGIALIEAKLGKYNKHGSHLAKALATSYKAQIALAVRARGEGTSTTEPNGEITFTFTVPPIEVLHLKRLDDNAAHMGSRIIIMNKALETFQDIRAEKIDPSNEMAINDARNRIEHSMATLHTLSQLGMPLADCNLASIYANGGHSLDKTPNNELAYHYLERAAEAGCLAAIPRYVIILMPNFSSRVRSPHTEIKKAYQIMEKYKDAGDRTINFQYKAMPLIYAVNLPTRVAETIASSTQWIGSQAHHLYNYISGNND